MAGMNELRQAAQQQREQQSTAREAAKEGVKEFGGMMKDIGGKLWDAVITPMTPMIEHGSHELATALLRGSDGYVMYQRQSKEGQSHEGQGMDSLRAYAKEMAEDKEQGREQSREIER